MSDEKKDLQWLYCKEFSFVSLMPAVSSEKDEGSVDIYLGIEGNLDIVWGTGTLEEPF